MISRRYDEPKLLDALESQLVRTLEQPEVLHEAQACTIIEALGALHYHGRSSTILTLLIERLHSVQQLLPHSAVALVHGLALLHVEPPAPLGIADIMRLMSASGLAIDPAEAGTLLWSLVQLGCAELAREAIRTLPVDIAETAQHADLHSLTLCLWSLLTLRCYEHRLTIAVLQAISQAASGVALPAQLCRIAECMLMLQLEAPPELGLVLPPLLCQKAQLAWQQVQLQVSCERSPQPLLELSAIPLHANAHHGALSPQVQSERAPQPLLEVSATLEALGLPHRVKVFNTYVIDALVPHDVTGGPTFAILLHAAKDYTSTGQLLGALQLKARLLQALGCVVIHIRHEEWNDQRTDEMRQRALRERLQPHMPGGLKAGQDNGSVAGAGAATSGAAQAALADPRAAMAAADPRASTDPRTMQ